MSGPGDDATDDLPPGGPAGWRDALPDVRDGLTRVERIVLVTLHALQKERGGRNVPTAQLYGRVVEHVNLTPGELTEILARLGARRGPW